MITAQYIYRFLHRKIYLHTFYQLTHNTVDRIKKDSVVLRLSAPIGACKPAVSSDPVTRCAHVHCFLLPPER